MNALLANHVIRFTQLYVISVARDTLFLQKHYILSTGFGNISLRPFKSCVL